MTHDPQRGRHRRAALRLVANPNPNPSPNPNPNRSEGDIGALLSDWRRLNVAFSRAKAKCVVLGSAATLAHSPLLSCFLQLVDANGWRLDLPPNADLLYEAPTPAPRRAAGAL